MKKDLTDKKIINKEYQGYIFDLDGVLWQGKKVINGAVSVINKLNQRKKKCMFVSNTSSHSYESCLKKINKHGFFINKNYLYVATRETALYIAKQSPGCSAYVIGTDELIYEMKKAGIKVFSDNIINVTSVKYVVVGNDRDINYTKLTNALHAIRAGALLVAVNNDLITPDEDNVRPAGGTLVAAVSVMTGHAPDINIAKPDTYLIKKALKEAELSSKKCVIIGDTIETDIAAGNALGMDTILVMSGNSSLEKIKTMEDYLKPTYIINNISKLLE